MNQTRHNLRSSTDQHPRCLDALDVVVAHLCGPTEDAPDLPLQDRLQLRRSCKTMRTAVNNTLTYAKFSQEKLNDAEDERLPGGHFWWQGWPLTVKVLCFHETTIERAISTIDSLLFSYMPHLEEVRIECPCLSRARLHILRRFAENTDRWKLKVLDLDVSTDKELEILCNTQWPHLEHITINGVDIELTNRQRLRSGLTNCDLDKVFPKLKEFEGDRIACLPGMLTKADLPHLTSLYMSPGVTLNADEISAFSTSSWLGQLKKLTLHYVNPEVTYIVGKLMLPQLTDLSMLLFEGDDCCANFTKGMKETWEEKVNAWSGNRDWSFPLQKLTILPKREEAEQFGELLKYLGPKCLYLESIDFTSSCLGSSRVEQLVEAARHQEWNKKPTKLRVCIHRLASAETLCQIENIWPLEELTVYVDYIRCCPQVAQSPQQHIRGLCDRTRAIEQLQKAFPFVQIRDEGRRP